MLSKIKIGNFKSIEKLELELAPLTIFVGPNSSGKSNVLESIAILASLYVTLPLWIFHYLIL